MISNYHNSPNFLTLCASIAIILLICIILLVSSMMSGQMQMSGIKELSNFSLTIIVDNKSLFFFLLVGLISFTVFMWSFYYMSSDYNLYTFYLLLFSFVSSMLILVLSDSFMMIFIGWEGLGISSFLLIIFYQNWMSNKGGLLTLLTNRVGDGVLMLVFSYWSISSMLKGLSISSVFLLMSLLLLTFTKSAQWPFVNWLPAAMAAPTPVSALVHSSTLVTAGAWLVVKFMVYNSLMVSVCLVIGVITLCLASSAALFEVDAKKVVALSTLSQLGVLFLSIGMGNVILCLFHIMTHAVAKANLFMVVGNILHKKFSMQDARNVSSGELESSLILAGFISVISLSGFLFLSGFFSKEMILFGQVYNMSSAGSFVFYIFISSFTLSYCTKLLLVILSFKGGNVMSLVNSKLYLLPILFMSAVTLLLGSFLSENFYLSALKLSSLESKYWMLLLFSGLLFMVLFMFSFNFMKLFSYNSNVVDFLNKSAAYSEKGLIRLTELSILESYYMISGNNILKLDNLSARFIIVTAVTMIFIVNLI